MRAAHTLRESHHSTQVLYHVLLVARARGGSCFPKLREEWHGLLGYTIHQATDARVQPGRLARRPSRVDIRETRRMQRRVSVD